MSIMDMIPEYETPTPIRKRPEKKINKGCGLIERVCPQCGKTFYFHRGETAYIRMVKGRTLRFCSWSCKCEDERKRTTAKPGGCTKTIEERIEERLMKMVADRALLNSEKGQLLPKKEKQRLINRLQRLHKEVKELRELEEHESASGVRGIAGGDH